MGSRENREAIAEEEKLLELYKELRTELRMQIQASNKLAMRGLAVIGAVTGYALYASVPALISIVPFIFGILFINRVTGSNEIHMYAVQLIELEKSLSEPGSPFRYEIRRGGAYGLQRAESGILGLPSMMNPFHTPVYIFFFMIVASYFMVIFAAIVVWVPNDPTLGATVQPILATLYAFLTGALVIVGVSHIRLRKRLRISVEYLLKEEQASGKSA